MSKKTPGKKMPVLAAEFKIAGLWAITFSPDNKTLVLGARKSDIALVEVGAWKVRPVPRPTWAPERHTVPFSPDSSAFLIAATGDYPLQCWDVATASLKWANEPGSMDAVFHPNGETFAATSSRAVLLGDSATGKTIHEMPGHKSRTDHLEFSPDGSRLASAGQTQVCLWDSRSGKRVAVVQEKQGEIKCIRFAPDGASLAVGGIKGVISIYESASGRKLQEWKATGSQIWDLKFNSDGTRLLSESFFGKDSAVRIWELPSARQVHQFASNTTWRISPDRQFVMVSSDQSLELRSLVGWEDAGNIPLPTPSQLISFTVSPDLNWLACELADGRTQVWSIAGTLARR